MSLVDRRHILNLLRHWERHPLRAGWLLFTLLLVLFAGPWACLMHCALHGTGHNLQHAHSGPHTFLTDTGCPFDGGASQSSNDLPSALTIAIVPIVAWLLLRSAPLQESAALLMLLRSFDLPPPRKPPRFFA